MSCIFSSLEKQALDRLIGIYGNASHSETGLTTQPAELA
jgi:hypothetical protein